jgi:hypothetical protein
LIFLKRGGRRERGEEGIWYSGIVDFLRLGSDYQREQDQNGGEEEEVGNGWRLLKWNGHVRFPGLFSGAGLWFSEKEGVTALETGSRKTR